MGLALAPGVNGMFSGADGMAGSGVCWGRASVPFMYFIIDVPRLFFFFFWYGVGFYGAVLCCLCVAFMTGFCWLS